MKNSPMPDISTDRLAETGQKLEQVGMTNIEMPIFVEGSDGKMWQILAIVSAFVSLDDSHAKGIHMSRLYISLRDKLAQDKLSVSLLKDLLLQFIDEQKGLSHNAFLKFAFQLPVPRKALKSEEWGWRYYPLSVEAAYAKKSEFSLKWQFDITYSSTCPCSAALAKQVVESEFINDFAHREVLKSSEVQQWLSEKALMATPHAQRSVAHIQLQMDTDSLLPSYIEIIDRVESALQTAVQTAVKREDEQEFARLNAANFMFCEDACRRIKNSLNNETRIKDFKIEVVHQESLHPHNAVSLAVKGVADGFIV